MKKGLVLAGGGAKGAYHIGVLEALQECNEKFDIITGTSIGALIGAMAAQNKVDYVVELWKQITVEDVIEGGVSISANFDEMYGNRDSVLRFFKKALHDKQVNIDPLKKIIEDGLDYDDLMNSDIDFGLVTYQISKNQPVMITKSQMTRENCKNYLLASASCFPAFPICSFEGEEYIDGGYIDNCPVELALAMGADELLVIDLDFKPNHPEFFGREDIRYVYPFEDTGSFLEFGREVLDHRIYLGYTDTLKVLKKLEGVKCTFKKNSLPESLRKAYYLTLLTWEIELNRGTIKKVLNPFSAQPLSSHLKSYTRQMILSKDEYALAALDELFVTFHENRDEIFDAQECVYQCIQFYEEHIEELKGTIEEVKSMKLPALRKLMTQVSQSELICILCKLIEDTNAKNTLLIVMTLLSKEFSLALFLACALEEYSEKA